MTFSTSACNVTIQEIDSSGAVISNVISGILISGNEVLTSSYYLSGAESGLYTLKVVIDPASVSPGTVPTSSISGVPTYTVSSSAIHATQTGVSGQNFAIIDLGSSVNLTSTVGYAGLAQDSAFTPTSTTETIYGYPPYSPAGQEYTSVTQQTITMTPTGEIAVTGGYARYSYNPSSWPIYDSASGMVSLDGATDIAMILNSNVSTGTNNSAATAFTSTTIAQIEYWQALDNESPAIQRIFHGLLSRAGSTSDVAFYSPSFVTDEQSVAQSQGATVVTSTAVLYSHPELTDYFLNSPEFTSAHPAIGGPATYTSQTALVNLLYQNDLGRSPSAQELQTYAGTAAHPVLFTNEQIVAFIVGSPEAIAHSGVWGQTGVLI